MNQEIELPEIGKFTKATAYDFLIALGRLVDFASAEDKETYVTNIEANFKPMAGGGASKNPSYMDEETGLMMHYCRFKQMFMAEEFMNMHKGKSKGASTIAALHDYQIGKKVEELKTKALKLFTAGEHTDGAGVNMEADALDATRKLAKTFDDENMAYIVEKLEAKKAAVLPANNEDSTESNELGE